MNTKRSDWAPAQLGNHVDILTGFPFKSAKYSEDENDIRLIRGDNVAQGYIRWNNAKRWDSNNGDDYSKYELQLNDVILAMDRPWIEAGLKYAWITSEDVPSLLVQRVARMRGINGLETNYLRYLIASPSFTDYIKPIVTGVAVPHISADQIKSYKFILPPLPTQRHIADILSAYDDLIENNTRRIRILEQMAQAIYQEWFGKVDKESLPEGWKGGIIRDFCESYNYGYTAKAQKGQDGIKYLRITDIVPDHIDWENVPSCEIDEDDIDKYLLREGDIVAARTGATTGYAKRLGKRHPKSIFASYLVRFRIQPEVSNHLIGLIVESDEYKKFIQANLGGAAQPMANAQVLTSFPLVIPPKELQKKFDFQVQPLFEEKEILQMKNANLRQTRDLLLPRLVSGEVEV